MRLAVAAGISAAHVARNDQAGVEELARACFGQFRGTQAAQQERGGQALRDQVEHGAVGGASLSAATFAPIIAAGGQAVRAVGGYSAVTIT